MRHIIRIAPIACLLFIMSVRISYAETFKLESPDKNITVLINTHNGMSFSLFSQGMLLLEDAFISMKINGLNYPSSSENINAKYSSADKIDKPIIPLKCSLIKTQYNEMNLFFSDGFILCLRLFNNGFAYRFQSSFSDEIIVNDETLSIPFSSTARLFFPEEESFLSHNERYYKEYTSDSLREGQFCSLPLLMELDDHSKILICESDLQDYPGMWMAVDDRKNLNACFPGIALEEKQLSDRTVAVESYSDDIASTEGYRSFPWRVFCIANSDKELLTNQMVWQLAAPLELEDTDWIKPGKVAWDWWNYNNVYGVDFEAGVNTATYKYYIDFAAAYGLEYIILDEGWYELGDLMKVVPDIDLEEIISYGDEKGVGVILWVVWKTLDEQLDTALDYFQSLGVKGIKVDFMQRDDQWMVNYYWKIAREAAKRQLLVDFHGAYKPCGLRRAYPNVMTREGVRGLEQNKWCSDQTPEHDLMLPFIRMVAGPMDYTPGSMLNATKDMFEPVYKRPMSQGSRCHQLAMYVVYESPLQMLADSPSNYYKETECMEFLSEVPVVWHDTRVLQASLGENIVMARRHHDEWFLGGMNANVECQALVDLSFLADGKWVLDLWRDGINADRCAMDYKKETRIVSKTDTVRINMATGGGFAAHLYQK